MRLRPLILLLALSLGAVALGLAVVRPWEEARTQTRSPSHTSRHRLRTDDQKPRAMPVPAAPAVAPATLEGRVVRAGRPAPDVRVTARDTGTFVETRTAADGSFTFEALPPGHYLVGALSGDEASPLVGPVALGPGQVQRDVVLELLAGAHVSGTVVDVRTGRTIAGALVRSSAGATFTDHAGRFRLGPLPIGGTFVEASARGYQSRVQWLSLDVAREYGGLELALRGAIVLRGRVTRLGKPVPGASVWAEKGHLSANGEPFGPVTCDAEGTFELEVASGDLELAASAPGGVRVPGPRLTIAEGGEYDALQIELGEALRATGTVTIDGRPAEGAGLYLIDAQMQAPCGTAVTGAGGAFAFDNISTGSYLLQVNAGVLTAQAGPFAVTGAEDPPWTVDLSSGRTLRGVVLPGHAGVRVRWRSSDWAGALFAETVTADDGSFSFAGVPERTVWLEAEGNGAFAQTEVDAQAREVTLKLEPSGVSGFVVDAEGRPVSDFLIRAVPLTGGVPRLWPVLNPDGEFQLTVPPGRYELFASASGHGESARGTEVTVEAGRITPSVRLTLADDERLVGQVVALPDMGPLSGVEVRVIRGRGGRAATYERLGVQTTDASGRFEMAAVPPTAWVSFSKDGFQTRSLTAKEIRDAYRGVVGLSPGRSPGPEQPKPYEGIGLQLQPNVAKGVFVAAVFDGSPAQAAGIVPGDQIVAVDGAPVAGLPLDEVIARITGPSGTTVRLSLQRAGRAFDRVLRRRTIQL